MLFPDVTDLLRHLEQGKVNTKVWKIHHLFRVTI